MTLVMLLSLKSMGCNLFLGDSINSNETCIVSIDSALTLTLRVNGSNGALTLPENEIETDTETS